VPMLSLDNTYSEDELAAFHERVLKGLEGDGQPAYVVEPKIDGIGIELSYEEGRFVRGATRGDGTIGEDVTANLRTIRSIPLRIPEQRMVEVRGEVYLPLAGFERVNAERAEAGLPTFMNPRNSAAGSLRQQDPAVTASRPLSIFTYQIGAHDGLPLESHWQALTWLRAQGFRTSERVELHDSVESALEACRA